MTPTTQLYATFTDRHFGRSFGDTQIKDEQDAVQQALRLHAVCFCTYETVSLTFAGRELKRSGGKPFCPPFCRD